MIPIDDYKKKSYNIKISFNLEIIDKNPEAAIKKALNKVECPGMVAANMEAVIINARPTEEDAYEF